MSTRSLYSGGGVGCFSSSQTDRISSTVVLIVRIARFKMSVFSVSTSTSHTFSKTPVSYIYLLAYRGVEGDVHCSSSPNPSDLRQVHLVDTSLFTLLQKPSPKYPSFKVSPGALGENITTEGLDLFSLSEGTRLHFGNGEDHAVVRVTGLREPRKRLEEWPKGLLERCKLKDGKGRTVGRRVGIMGVVDAEGYVQPGDSVWVEDPKTFRALRNV